MSNWISTWLEHFFYTGFQDILSSLKIKWQFKEIQDIIPIIIKENARKASLGKVKYSL